MTPVGHPVASGGLMVMDFGGGLGPLGGRQARASDTLTSAGGNGSPALGPTTVVALLALVAISVRRRLD